MEITLGTLWKPEPPLTPTFVKWNSETLINSHILLLGKSGSGKSYTIRDIINQMCSNQKDSKLVRIHVIDVHGDLIMDNESTIMFSESTNQGLNPLFINPDPNFGGVRKKILSFTDRLEKSGFKLGSKQEATLKALLLDLYLSFGFNLDDSKTWTRKIHQRQVTLNDAVDFAEQKLKTLYLGADSKSILSLEKLYSLKRRLNEKQKELHKLNSLLSKSDSRKDVLSSEVADLQENLLTIINDTKQYFGEHLDSLQTGYELDDLIKYDSKDVMKSVLDRLKNLQSSGVYRSVLPKFDESKVIWRYNIRAFSEIEQRLFVSTLIDDIFLRRTQEDYANDIVECIVIDEAHKFFSDDDENPVNKVAKEARKFGLGLLAASQSPRHFSDDFLSNVGTKILLNLDPLFWKEISSKLKVSEKALEFIIPHKTFLVSMDKKGTNSKKYIPLNVLS